MQGQKKGKKLKVWIYLKIAGTRGEPSFGSGCNCSFDGSVEKILLASKMNDAKLENEEFRLNAIQKAVVLKAMIKTILELEERVEFVENEKKFFVAEERGYVAAMVFYEDSSKCREEDIEKQCAERVHCHCCASVKCDPYVVP